MMPLALLPRALARVMYSDLGIVTLGRPRNSLIMSKGNATSPAPQKIMNSSHPVAGILHCSSMQSQLSAHVCGQKVLLLA